MNNHLKVKLILSPIERTTIVAALMAYGGPGFNTLAHTVADAPTFDPADDGPEVEMLRHLPWQPVRL